MDLCTYVVVAVVATIVIPVAVPTNIIRPELTAHAYLRLSTPIAIMIRTRTMIGTWIGTGTRNVIVPRLYLSITADTYLSPDPIS